MKILFAIFWVFMLLSAWFATCSHILDSDNISKTFKYKTLFFWLIVVLSVFSGYYLFK